MIGEELKVSKNHEEVIEVYLNYLTRLKKVCVERNIPYKESDRKLYLMDKKFNKEFKLK